MNYKSLTTLEYDKIIDRLVSFAASDKAKERLKKLVPMTDIHDINAALSETSDALSRVYAKGAVSFGGVHDVGASVKRLEIGSSLNTVELLHISSLLTAAARVKNYYEDTTDSLTGYFHALEPLTPLNTEIKRCILSEDEISDDASANLRSIRRQKVLAAERIHTELNKMLNSSSVRNCIYRILSSPHAPADTVFQSKPNTNRRYPAWCMTSLQPVQLFLSNRPRLSN